MEFKETKAAKKHLSFSGKKTFADVFLSDDRRRPSRNGKREFLRGNSNT